jgi:hypothetical protein
VKRISLRAKSGTEEKDTTRNDLTFNAGEPDFYLIDLLLRGFQFTHEAVRDWEARFTPLLAERLWRRRKGKIGCRATLLS